MSLQEYGRLPLISERTLRRHHAYESADNRFRSAARLRQALLREQQGWPIGEYRTARGTRRKLGSYVNSTAGTKAVNFITPEVARLVRREVAYREEGALIDEGRLWTNLLSSAPATFNVLGPMKLNLRLATAVLRSICPDFVRRVTAILFEHSPARSHPAFTHDRTAFDALGKCETRYGSHGFVAIELKYSESMTEPPARVRPRYDVLSRTSGLYRDPDHPALRQNPLQQLWRQHMLAAAMVQNGLYSTGRFILVAPTFNTQVAEAVCLYRQHLTDDPPVDFDAVSLETVIAAIKRAGADDIGDLLHDRYCNFDPVDALI
jgi:hypothetical protein